MNSSLFKHFPQFDLGDFMLREIKPEQDAEEFLLYINHSSVRKFLSSNDLPEDLDSAIKELRYWQSLFFYCRSFFWAIVEKKEDKIIGMIGFNSYSQEHSRAEISYDLSYDFWGRGIMRKSMAKVIQFAHEEMLVHRIQATVACNNERSISLLESAGFEREGLLRKYGCLGGEILDHYMYGKV